MNHSHPVILWINKAKANKTCQIPTYARLTVSGKRAETATGSYKETERWNFKEGNMKGQLWQVFAIP